MVFTGPHALDRVITSLQARSVIATVRDQTNKETRATPRQVTRALLSPGWGPACPPTDTPIGSFVQASRFFAVMIAMVSITTAKAAK
ncbi:hypothetical protein JOF56_002298 [Kibdelosporangium banguiense]|uniref:Uncharacterized protein n=1 Tax=Kibdelosporangium banguiense TaxID=1365924 RepID=A0ABS4TBX2_9PSEU|nr:hypothetical protein [Kibdelosporangium banguiense]